MVSVVMQHCIDLLCTPLSHVCSIRVSKVASFPVITENQLRRPNLQSNAVSVIAPSCLANTLVDIKLSMV